MATIVLGALGTLVGGPLGGAIGALIGRQVDSQVIGGTAREGPRLKELAVSTSSYGQPIARHYGRVRAPGTIVWSSDLIEHRDSEGGGKGRPSSVTYSYSVSFAAVLSSRPIDRVGRIWADGNLLRGAAGDLKTGGSLRVYTGLADQPRDPLLAAVLGEECPAHRGCAYAVFEDLQLADFGNRIPALSFEIFAGPGSDLVERLVEDESASADAPFAQLQGFSHEGGSLAQTIALVDALHPVVPVSRGGALAIVSADAAAEGEPPILPAPARWNEGEFGREDGIGRARQSGAPAPLSALRYYDAARDYQPGLQRPEGHGAGGGMSILEFPGTLAADDARALARDAAVRGAAQRDTLAWRLADLDPGLGPGAIVRAPGESGLWRIVAWEWREAGIELQLLRHIALPAIATPPSDPGRGWEPRDRLPQPSLLRAFELPWDGVGAADARQVFAAISAPAGRWPGATLYLDRAGALVPSGSVAKARAAGGALEQALAPSDALLLEPRAEATVVLADETAALAGASAEALAGGANRLLVGAEVMQFARADALGAGRWRLSGLLRGRGGTEAEAAAGHPPGTAVTLLDDRLLAVPPAMLAGSSAPDFAAIGLADAQPVFAATENAGAGRKPPSPVHPRSAVTADGSVALGWTRRARGGWTWLDEVEQPLVEQNECYTVGIGPADAPAASWLVSEPALTLPPGVAAAHSGAPVWVRQRGSYAVSDPLFLTTLP